MGMLKEFKQFALKGNVIDLAVAVVIGSAFGKIVASFVANIIMPPLNLLTARYGVDFNDFAVKITTMAPTLEKDGSKKLAEDGSYVLTEQLYPILNVGPFIQTVVDFLIVAIAIFFAVKAMNTIKKRFEEEKEAPVKKIDEQIVLLREIRDSLRKD